jgi:hypothetical protein
LETGIEDMTRFDMRKHFARSSVFSLLLLLIVSCSGNEQALVTKNSTTSLENSLIVMRIKWVDSYGYPDKKDREVITSSDLLKRTDLFRRREVEEGKPELYGYLHYLNRFTFLFENDTGEEQNFIRFGKDTRQYEPIAIYQFSPGDVSLVGIETYQEQFNAAEWEEQMNSWTRTRKNLDQDFGKWNLPKGKIVYLGDLTFYYHTQRFVFGSFKPEELVESTTLLRIEMKDRFEETRTMLKDQKPWFPADDVINLSSENEWVYKQILLEEEDRPEEETDLKEEQPKKDKGNSFF